MSCDSSIRTVLICVNGILTMPGESSNWTGRAVTWCQLRTAWRAEKVEYFSGVLLRSLRQKARARKLMTMLSYYEGWHIILVGHSNGCDVILDALQLANWPTVQEVHLFSAACEADFDRNGINAAGRQIGRVVCYQAEKDWALRLADTFTGRRVFGFGTLGRSGPINAKRLVEVVKEPIGHGDWFARERFDKTMGLLTGGRGV